MLKFGLIGCGRIGTMHANILHQEDDVILESVFDINKNFAKVVSNKTGAKVCNQDSELFKNKDIDAILIASVTSTHADYIEKALTNHKPVFCEKPIDLSLNRIRQCYNRIKKNDLPIQIGFNRRFDPSHAKIKYLLKENKIGQLNQVIITSRDPEMPSEEYYKSAGGLFRDMTIHDFDLARFMLGEEPVKVFAISNALIDPKIKSELNDSDTLMIIMETASGKQCHINNSRSATYGYDQRVELFGSKGMVISENRKPHELKKYNSEFVDKSEPYLNFFIERYQESYMNSISSFVETILEKKPVSVGFEDGRRALLLAETAYKSVKSGRMENID